jgi:hypothetical protein
MFSPDGIHWGQSPAPANAWTSVTYGNGLFVAVANTGIGSRVMTSPDGFDWTSRTSAADNAWNSVTYGEVGGQGLFVAVATNGSGNRVMTSPDGITWTSRTSATDKAWQSVTYGSGLFVAVAIDGTGNDVMTSPNGVTWTSRASAVGNVWMGVSYGNGLFVAVGYVVVGDGADSRVMTSPDGITWTSRTYAADNAWTGVTYGNGRFVAVAFFGLGNRVMTSGPPAATNVLVVSDTSITATTPAGTAGTASVLVTTAAGTNVANTLYTYAAPAPTVTGISPNSGTTLGGTSVTITGTNLAGASAVTIGGNACTPLSANSATSATCTTAAHAAGAVSVLVTTSGGTNAANTLYTFVTPAAPEPVVPFIPPLTSLPLVPGVSSSLLTVLNLIGGAGPALTGCLRDTLSTQLGSEWLYQGQGADGGARLGQAAQIISFYAVDANSSISHGAGQGAGIYPRGANQLDVVTACGTFVTTPAMYNLGEFGALLNAAGLTVQINAQGVMTVQVGALIYVARPDYLVTQGTPGAPGLTTGTDGLMRFTDSAGHIQILYPAFLDPEVLGNQVAVAVSGHLVIQTDGTGLVTLLSGEKFVLTPDMTLGTVPPEQFAVGWWQDGPNHYRYRNSSYSNTSQGFTVTRR